MDLFSALHNGDLLFRLAGELVDDLADAIVGVCETGHQYTKRKLYDWYNIYSEKSSRLKLSDLYKSFDSCWLYCETDFVFKEVSVRHHRSARHFLKCLERAAHLPFTLHNADFLFR